MKIHDTTQAKDQEQSLGMELPMIPEDSLAIEREQQLIKDMIEKEAKLAALELEYQQYDKQINHIKRSKTWKIMQPFRKFIDFLSRLIGRKEIREQKHYINELETTIKALQDDLYQTRAELRSRLLDDRLLDSQTMIHMLRELKSEGALLDFINEAIKDKNQHERQYRNALVYAARLFMNEKPEQKNHVFQLILSALKTEDIPEFMVRPGSEEEHMSLQPVASFRASLHMRMRQKQLTDQLPEFMMEDKVNISRFIDPLNIRKPQIFGRNKSLDDMTEQDNVVVKPVDGAGSRGVYLVHSSNDIIDVHRATQLKSWQHMLENMQEDLQLGLVETDAWLIEELILENKTEHIPASDIKFYCFYGRVGLILEITRYPERKHCWWTADGERIRTGKYDEDLFKGQGVSMEDIEMASNLSLEIPAPFIRIDFLRAHDGLVFGEFTAKPGNYDEFNETTDQWLGDYYLGAENRLTHDLLAGKQFEAFKEFKEQLSASNV